MCCTCLARQATAQQQHGGLCSSAVSHLFTYSFFIFNDFCQTNYLKIYGIGLHQILNYGCR